MMLLARFKIIVHVYRFGPNGAERVSDKEFGSYQSAQEWIERYGDASMSPMESYIERPTSQPSS